MASSVGLRYGNLIIIERNDLILLLVWLEVELAPAPAHDDTKFKNPAALFTAAGSRLCSQGFAESSDLMRRHLKTGKAARSLEHGS